MLTKRDDCATRGGGEPVTPTRNPGTECEFCWLRVPDLLYWPLYQPHRLGRVKERLADSQRAPLHLALQPQRINAAFDGDVAVFVVIVDVLSCERIKRQCAITYLDLLLMR